jgi:prolyl-tRNA synthetase
VPLRIEIGPKDVAKGSVVLARRDKPGKEGKSFVLQEGLAAAAGKALEEIQMALLTRARAFRDAHTQDPKNYDEFKAAVEAGFAFSYWCGGSECEERIKEETKATVRCVPLGRARPDEWIGQPGGPGPCILCGQASSEKGIFGRAY